MLLLALAIFSLFFMTLAIFPASPLIAAELKINPTLVSGVFGISSLLATILSLPAGIFSDRRGRKPLILCGLAVATLSLLICRGGNILPVFIVGWMLFGVGRGLFFSPMFTIPADLFDFRERGRAVGIITGAVGLGSVVGFVLGGLISEAGGWRLLFLVGAGLLALTTLIVIWLPETNREKSQKMLSDEIKGAVRWLARPGIANASLIAALSFAVGICATFLTPFAAAQHRISPTLVAFLFLPYEFVASVGAPIVGSIADRIGRRVPLLVCLPAIAAAVFTLAFVGISPLTLLICYSLVGLSEGPVVALTTAVVIDQAMRIDVRGIGAALGSYRLVQGLGLAFGTAIGGYLLDTFGTTGSYAALGAVVVALIGFGLALKDRSELGPASSQPRAQEDTAPMES